MFTTSGHGSVVKCVGARARADEMSGSLRRSAQPEKKPDSNSQQIFPGGHAKRTDTPQLRQTPMNKSDHNGYWAALERSKLVRLGVRNRSQ